MLIDLPRLKTDVTNVLGHEGLLEQRVEGFSYRPGQLEMALDIAESIANNQILVAEGGTGIGKTLAYIVPAILSGQKVVVATGTKTLQEQIFFKDLPLLLNAIDLPIRATYMKGRSNYLCLLRYRHFSSQRLFRFASDGLMFDEIAEWAETTQTGDRAELLNMPDDYASWNELTSNSENCMGSRCKFYKECFVTLMRKRAMDADLIIVNHHLYFADLAVRERAFGEVIPTHDLVIFDEAHLLESVATQYFGVSASNYRIYSLLDDIAGFIKPGFDNAASILKTTEQLRTKSVRFFELFFFNKGRFKLDAKILDEYTLNIYFEIDNHLGFLISQFKKLADTKDEASGFAERILALANDLSFLTSEFKDDYVYWGEIRKRGVYLTASPLKIDTLMQKFFFEKQIASIFTSATLATGDSFSYFKKRLGLCDDTIDKIFKSPFDFRRQSLLFLPRVLPEPSNHQFTQRASEIIGQLIRISSGSALVLFTSYANMNDIYDRLKDKLPYTILKQGDAPRNQLLEQFRNSVDSVLFATGTFWQGVDVLGESLRMVIIDKLPFESPGDPVIEARINFMKKNGQNAFAKYQVPAAIMQLKQGVGRLIRDPSDWGLVAILDKRITSKGYGKRFLKALPELKKVDRLDHVKSWWTRKSEMNEL